MSQPVSRVNPSNNAFSGGSITRASPPTSASGSFVSVGASGFPNPSVPAIANARNDRGSNVTIPYARVVPLHSHDKLSVKHDALAVNSNKEVSEYDGLEKGEIAWVLSRQFPMTRGTTEYYSTSVQVAGMTSMPPTSAGPALPPAMFEEGTLLIGSRPHLMPSGAGGGFGVDRLQRLAYSSWMFAHFDQRVGKQVINLKEYNMFNDVATELSSVLDSWKGKNMKNAHMFAIPDLAYGLQTLPSSADVKDLQVKYAMTQGLFAMERGPFLRSIGVDHYPVEIHADVNDPQHNLPHQHVDRHLGSHLAQAALETCLKEHGVFNWVPDGICLSKYETGPDPMSDAQFDARTSQLFNVAVQGPAISKSWCGDSKLVCMPMDKVFILVVADLAYKLDADGAGSSSKAARDMTGKMVTATRKRDGNTLSSQKGDPFATELGKKTADSPFDNLEDNVAYKNWLGKPGVALTDNMINGTEELGKDQRSGMLGYEQSKNEGGTPEEQAFLLSRAQGLWNRVIGSLGQGSNDVLDQLNGVFDKTAKQVRTGQRGVKSASLLNFRLMRATSSYLTSKSHYNPKDKDSRLGLKLSYDDKEKAGYASFVVGGWCIGTVLDSAASRTTAGSVVRVSAESMAMNINVNVEWWSADKLYVNYQDKEAYYGNKPSGTMAQRDVITKEVNEAASLDVDTEANEWVVV